MLFLTKIIAIYLHHQRSRIREKLPFCLCRCTDPKLCLLITHKIQDLQGPFLFKRRQKIWRAFQNWGKNSRSPNQYCAKAEFWGLFWQCSIVTMATDLASETSLKITWQWYYTDVKMFFFRLAAHFINFIVLHSTLGTLSGLFNIQVIQNYSGQKKSVCGFTNVYLWLNISQYVIWISLFINFTWNWDDHSGLPIPSSPMPSWIKTLKHYFKITQSSKLLLYITY